jgi:ubiquitin-like protein Pup
MSERARPERDAQRRGTQPADDESVDEAAPAAARQDEALDEDVDAVLDEIDAVLEANAAEFVQGFVQKGGQ